MDKTVCLLLPCREGVTGGAELFAEDLVRNLKNKKIKVDIKYLPFIHDTRENLIQSIVDVQTLDLSDYYGIIYTKFPSYTAQHPNSYLYLIHQYRQFYEFYETRFSSFGNNLSDESLRFLIYNMENKVLNNILNKKAISKNVADRLSVYFDIQMDHIYIPPPFKKLYRSGDYGNYVLFVSRLEEDKRPHLFIDSFSHLPENIRGIMVGDGSLRDKINMMIESRGLRHRIELKSNIDIKELVKLYQDSLCIVFCPFDEDYGFITLEAFMSKKPVITIEDSGGVLEFVDHGHNGFICKEDSSMIAEKIISLHNNKKLAYELGNTGYEKIKKISYDPLIDDIRISLGL